MNSWENLTMGCGFLLCALLWATAVVRWRHEAATRKRATEPPPLELARGGVLSLRGFHPADLAIVLAVFLIWVFLWLGQAFFMDQAAEGGASDNPTSGFGELSVEVVISGIMLQGSMAAIALGVLFWRVRVVEFWGLLWRHWWIGGLVAVGAVCLFFSGNILLRLVGYEQLVQQLYGESQQDLLQAFQATQDIPALVMISLMAVLVAPVCEELLFRGYLYPALKRFGGVWVAAPFNVLLFALIHGQAGMLVPFFLLGSLLVWSLEFTRSLWTPMMLHFLNNSIVVVVMWVQRSGSEVPLAIP